MDVVKKYKGTLSNVVISSNHNNLPVTSIGQFAFSYCDSLTNATITYNYNENNNEQEAVFQSKQCFACLMLSFIF